MLMLYFHDSISVCQVYRIGPIPEVCRLVNNLNKLREITVNKIVDALLTIQHCQQIPEHQLKHISSLQCIQLKYQTGMLCRLNQ